VAYVPISLRQAISGQSLRLKACVQRFYSGILAHIRLLIFKFDHIRQVIYKKQCSLVFLFICLSKLLISLK